MMKSIFGMWAVSVAVCMLTAEAQASTITGGNDIIDRSTLDTYGDFALVDTNQPITGTGEITGWSLYAVEIFPVELIIVDPHTYAVVGVGDLVTPALGVNNFLLGSPISVVAGDWVGYYTSGTGVVPFTFGGAPIHYQPNGSGAPSVGTVLTNLEIEGTRKRIYSLSVTGTGAAVPEPSTIALLGLGAVGLMIARRRTVTV